jgi:hypothetical protein
VHYVLGRQREREDKCHNIRREWDALGVLRIHGSAAACRGPLYEMASIDPAIFRKNGNATIVDYQRVDRNLSKLPLAEIKQTKDT